MTIRTFAVSTVEVPFHGISATLDQTGQLVLTPSEAMTAELLAELQDRRQETTRELWTKANAAVIASIPETASGPELSADKYRDLRAYIDQPGPAVLVEFHGAGPILRVTPPNDVLPAGAVTVLLPDGEWEDCDTRILSYPDGRPVADVLWRFVAPKTGGARS